MRLRKMPQGGNESLEALVCCGRGAIPKHDDEDLMDKSRVSVRRTSKPWPSRAPIARGKGC